MWVYGCLFSSVADGLKNCIGELKAIVTTYLEETLGVTFVKWLGKLFMHTQYPKQPKHKELKGHSSSCNMMVC